MTEPISLRRMQYKARKEAEAKQRFEKEFQMLTSMVESRIPTTKSTDSDGILKLQQKIEEQNKELDQVNKKLEEAQKRLAESSYKFEKGYDQIKTVILDHDEKKKEQIDVTISFVNLLLVKDEKEKIECIDINFELSKYAKEAGVIITSREVKNLMSQVTGDRWKKSNGKCYYSGLRFKTQEEINNQEKELMKIPSSIVEATK
jgi:hypothetical protein